jgi:putative transposase
MPRRARRGTAGVIFHVVNRSARRGPLFECADDYRAFEALLIAAVKRFGVALIAYSLMPNHFHFVIIPARDGALSRFMHWLETTHATRWHLTRGTLGQGAVYQGRFKAIPVAPDRHALWVCRYVERNAARARLVDRAEDWPWSSLWQRLHNPDSASWLAPWPVPRPADWLEYVNTPHTAAELESLRRAVRQCQPFGEADWQKAVRAQMGSLRNRPAGRPPKRTPDPLTDL